MNNSTLKSKARKMTGGENKEIKETFQRKSPMPGINPYDLTISTTSDNKINLEIKITTTALPFTTFKESFSASLKSTNNNNRKNISSIIDLFDKKIERTTYIGIEYVKNNQTILFEFNLNDDNSEVIIGGESIVIKTKFKNVLFNLFSNNSKKLLKVRNNGITFKSVVNKIQKK
jgi:hypothetical protein